MVFDLLLYLVSFIATELFTHVENHNRMKMAQKSKTFSLWVLSYAVVILYKICLFCYGTDLPTEDLRYLCSSVKSRVEREKATNSTSEHGLRKKVSPDHNNMEETLLREALWWFLGTTTELAGCPQTSYPLFQIYQHLLIRYYK